MNFDETKQRVLVALGGKSAERKISIESGKAVARALEEKGYQTAILDTGTGKLIQLPEVETLQTDPKQLPTVVDYPLVDIKRHFSIVFIALHGKFGEDGTLQGLFDNSDIKYVGSKAYSSAVAMEKDFSKSIFRANGIPTLESQVISSENDKLNIQFPVVVKPITEGSSIKVAICDNDADYQFAIKNVLQEYGRCMVEPYIKGQEFTVAVLENEKGTPEALPVIEIISKSKFFDTKAKYDGTTEEIVSPKIDKKLESELKEIAVKTHKALNCRHLSRVDIIVDKDKPFVLELNTIPGMTSESLFPKASKAAGISFENLVDHLVRIASK